MKYKKQGHCVYYAKYHLVVTTRYRRKVIRGGMGAYLRRCILSVQRRYPEIGIIEVNTHDDHMHVLVSVPSKMSVSQVVNLIKSNTGRAMRKRFTFLNKVYKHNPGIWFIGYFASTVGIDEAVIQRYIEHQGKEDSGQVELEF